MELSKEDLRLIARYCIPAEMVENVTDHECRYTSGGHTKIITMIDGCEGWHGCGHPSCTQCEYRAAGGVVGDNAIKRYAQAWLRKMEQGEDVPEYVYRFLESF